MSSKESPMSDSHLAGRIFAHTRRWLIRYDVLLLILTVLLLFLWPRLWQNIFSDDRFMPHGMCYLWIPQLLSLHLISDSLIGFSYLAISATGRFIRSKRNWTGSKWLAAGRKKSRPFVQAFWGLGWRSIHEVPNLSLSIAKREAKNVSCIAMKI